MTFSMPWSLVDEWRGVTNGRLVHFACRYPDGESGHASCGGLGCACPCHASAPDSEPPSLAHDA